MEYYLQADSLVQGEVWSCPNPMVDSYFGVVVPKALVDYPPVNYPYVLHFPPPVWCYYALYLVVVAEFAPQLAVVEAIAPHLGVVEAFAPHLRAVVVAAFAAPHFQKRLTYAC